MVVVNGSISHLPLVASDRGSEPAADRGEDDLHREQARLKAAIAAARKRSAAARHRADSREDAARSALRAELAGAREALAEMERRHCEAIDALRTETMREVESILQEGRRRAGDRDAAAGDLDGPRI